MHSHERRELAEIENRLALDDPEWFRQFSGTPPVHGAQRLRIAAALFTSLLAVAAVLVADAVGFALCAVLAAMLFAFRSWPLHSD